MGGTTQTLAERCGDCAMRLGDDVASLLLVMFAVGMLFGIIGMVEACAAWLRKRK